jgi:hypothetical protein
MIGLILGILIVVILGIIFFWDGNEEFVDTIDEFLDFD